MADEDKPLLGRPGLLSSRSKLQVKDYVAGAAAVIMVILGITAIAVVSAYQTRISYEYGVVLDAGSTHTELMVYRWSKEHVIQGTGLVEQIGLCPTKDGGIASFVNKDPSQAGPSLQSCIDSSAKKLVPSYQQDETPIYLGATAGMRLVDETNKAASTKIMESVRQTLHNSPFQFKDDYARIISGEEEGVSSWVTVNYVMGKLLYREVSSNKSESTAHLFGALDMGGASTQIKFSPSQNGDSGDSIHHVSAYGRHYQLYTHSYLCYGKRETERRYMASLIDNKTLDQNQAFDNPCGAKGLTQNLSVRYLTQPPCIQTPRQVPINISTVAFRGTSNLTQCIKQVQKLFNFTQCPKNNCSFNGVYQPSTEKIPFLAFSSYYYVIKDLNLTRSEMANISLGRFKEAADKICRQTWEEIIHGKSPSLQPLLETTCFDAQYIYTLLSKGYHIKDDSTQVKFQNLVNKRSLGWALGFMINATNLIPNEEPEYRVKTGPFLAVVIVGAILIALGILLGVMATRRVIHRQKLTTGGLAI